jgi:parvulin-like peptidyl-prolyl isomerase
MSAEPLARPQQAQEYGMAASHGSEVKLQHWSFLRKLMREPLLHFLLAGLVIFAVYTLLSPAPLRTGPSNQIVLTKDDLRQLAMQWIAQGRPVPTTDQMHALVEQKLSEEMLFREAMALGLDKDDEIIKRRLAQKMGFLAEDVAALQSPSEAELRTWFTQNAKRFALPPRASFRHLYFSFDRQGAHDRAAATLQKIGGKPSDAPDLATAADRFMFQDYYAERAPEQIAKVFGPDFAKALFQLKPGAWQGPVESGYGWHLVFVDTIEPGRVPAFEEIESDVKSAWLDEKQREVKRIALEAIRARYTIIVPPTETVDLRNLRNPQAPLASTEVFPQ